MSSPEVLDEAPTVQVTCDQLLRLMFEKGASDMHITAHAPPYLRVDGDVFPIKIPPLSPADTRHLIFSLLTKKQIETFEEKHELDISFELKGVSRYRGNVFYQRGTVAASLRTIPFKIRTFADLGCPPVVSELCNRPAGLVLVTGATGSGKSTTLASMIDKINTEQRLHIMTIEDPIEFVHHNKLSIINQREVGDDTYGFTQALKSVLRQDPDCVLVGEMRDLETIEAALTIAETGHLVFGTLHTSTAVSTINRIIDVFPPHQQDQIRTKLSFVLQGVICQQLLPRADGPGRALGLEVMVPTPAIRNLMREGKNHQIYGQMQIGQGQSGMLTLNQCLMQHLQAKRISVEMASERTSEPDELRGLIAKWRQASGE